MSTNSDSLDGLSPAISSASLSRRSNTSVRPRNRKLVSVSEDDEEDGTQTTTSRLSSSFARLTPSQSRGTTPSPHPSGRSSPLPSKGFSRVSERDFDNNRYTSERPGGRDTFKAYNSSQTSSGFFESSWSSIQSLASSVLGNELKWSKPGSSSTFPTKRRKPSRSDIPVSLSRQTGPSSWGPPVPSTPQIGTGTKEDRQAMVQAKKREVLLLANGDSLSDLRSQYKRKDSIESPDTRATDPDQDEEALVYVHHVQPNDTMTGVSIKYGCQLAVFRKANGFWPSDSIQTRKTVLLPAEACSVKGRRVNRAGNLDLLGDELSGQEDLGGSSIVPSESRPEQNEPQQTIDENERAWKHEAWVQMEGFPGPVEIGRVPRKSLGFFPRSRRKSLSLQYSDTEPSTPVSAASTLQRIGSSSEPNQRDSSPRNSMSSSRLTSGTHSSLRGSRTAHRRTGSITLQGPGGVGTLGREVHAPGPAQDGLSKFVSQHLPNLAVPPPPAPSSSLRKASFDSNSSVLSSSSTGLENVGGAIEGWMRKIALRATTSLSELHQQPSSQGQALGIAGLGDLIELNDGLEGTTPPASANNNFDSRNGYFTARNNSSSSNNQATGNSQYRRFSRSPSSMSRSRPRGGQEETYNKYD